MRNYGESGSLSTCYKQIPINTVAFHTTPCFNITQHYYEQLRSKNVIKFPKTNFPNEKKSGICFCSCSIISFSLPLLIIFNYMPYFDLDDQVHALVCSSTLPCLVQRRVSTWLFSQCSLVGCWVLGCFFILVPNPHSWVRIFHFFLAGLWCSPICSLQSLKPLASLSVVDGSAQSWLGLPLTVHKTIHLSAAAQPQLKGSVAIPERQCQAL